MAAVILELKKRKPVTTATFAPSNWHEVIGQDAIILVLFFFFKYWVSSLYFSLSSITLIKRLFSSSLFSVIRGVLPSYMRLLIFLLVILIPSYNSSSLAFHMMCSVYKLNKQDDNIQPCCIPLSILNQSVVPYKVLTVASWPAYRFLRRQVSWSSIPISLRVFTVCYDPHSQRL